MLSFFISAGVFSAAYKYAENWCLRLMLTVHWSDDVSNEDLWLRTGVFSSKPDFLPKIIKRQLSFIGHIVRTDGLERSILLGNCVGVRSRGRPRYSVQDNVKRWTDADIKVEDCMDCKRWRAMVATPAKQHGTWLIIKGWLCALDLLFSGSSTVLSSGKLIWFSRSITWIFTVVSTIRGFWSLWDDLHCVSVTYFAFLHLFKFLLLSPT